MAFARYKMWNRNLGKPKMGSKAPAVGTAFSGIIKSVDSLNETVKPVHHGGESKASSAAVKHPYVGPTSWIRVMPEAGTTVTVYEQQDTRNMELAGYVAQPGRVENYVQQKSGTTYRKLDEGEIEIQSSGLAQAHFSRRGDLSLRGGLVWLHLRNSRMEIEQRAPLHRRSQHLQAYDTLGAEERFGSVQRPGLINKAAALWIPKTFEYYRALGTSRPNIPGPMVLVHEGDVLDESGLPILASGPIPGTPLRGKYQWATEAGENLTVEIDVLGNLNVTLPASALGGLKIAAGLGQIALTTTGIVTATRISLDGVSWNHGHITPFGLTSGPIPLGP